MKENKICITLAQLFPEDSKKLFQYNKEKNLIYVDKEKKENTKTHEMLFLELQDITTKLNEINCDYSIDEHGDIILNCSDKDLNCSIK